MTDHTPPTTQQLDEIEAWARSPLGPGMAAEQKLFASLVAEVRRLRAELAANRAQAWRDLADRADPQRPEISFFGDHGHIVGEWMRQQAEYEERAAAAVVPAVVETGEAGA